MRAAGRVHVAIEGEEVAVSRPRSVDEAEARQALSGTALPDPVQRPPGFFRIRDYRRMTVTGLGAARSLDDQPCAGLRPPRDGEDAAALDGVLAAGW